MFKSSTSGGTAFASIETKLSGGAADDPGLPAVMHKAVRYMLAGAGVTAVFGIFVIIVTIVAKNSIDVKGKPLTSSELLFAIIVTIITYAVYVLLWVLMARFNRAGMKWARIVASVLFAISTFQLYETIDSLHGGEVITATDIIYIIFAIAMWVAGVGAIAMLWRPQSSAYFTAQTAARQ
jgi:surface polysaccharide O-acyltransferase-like enzyme